jgi:nucleotide-binding universal stress UspA family protein
MASRKTRSLRFTGIYELGGRPDCATLVLDTSNTNRRGYSRADQIKEVVMKNVLLLVHNDPGQEARFQVALDLVRALNGHLSCIDVTVLPVPVFGVYEPEGEAMLLQIEREREAHNRATLEARLQVEGVQWTWIDTTDAIADAVLDAATLADIIVLNRRLVSMPHSNTRDIASQVVMHARKPVVAVPETIKRFGLGRALIAWDGEEACAATMRACLPLLALAEEVEIFTVRNGGNTISPTEAAEYLSRYGIHAAMRVVEDDRALPDRLIITETQHWQADYIVMGAYNRGRLAELFGGVTKRLLSDGPVPLVMSH